MNTVEIVIRGQAKSDRSALAVMLLRLCETYGIKVNLIPDAGESQHDLDLLVPRGTAFASIAEERFALPIPIRTEQVKGVGTNG